VVLTAVGCGTKAPSSPEVADALVTSGIERPVAECVADAVTTTLTDDELVTLVERGAGGAPRDDPSDPDDVADRLREAMATCRDLAARSAAETSPGADPGAESSPGG
jgi:hypothetical protein